MSNEYTLKISLITDTTFGSGQDIPGLIDIDICYDPSGIPFVHGKTIKNILAEESSNILFCLHEINPSNDAKLEKAAIRLWGETGSRTTDQGLIGVGRASLPSPTKKALQNHIHNQKITPQEILEALTTTRRCSSQNLKGGPDDGSLRNIRFLLRDTLLESSLDLPEDISNDEKGLLAASVMAFRRAGVGRNRGSGRLNALLWEDNQNITEDWFTSYFQPLLENKR